MLNNIYLTTVFISNLIASWSHFKKEQYKQGIIDSFIFVTAIMLLINHIQSNLFIWVLSIIYTVGIILWGVMFNKTKITNYLIYSIYAAIMATIGYIILFN